MSKKQSEKTRIPMRRCIGCMESKPKKELIRIAFYEGELTVDRTGKAKGRGVYLCPGPDCVEKARKRKAFQRNFKTNFPEETLEQIFKELLNDQQ